MWCWACGIWHKNAQVMNVDIPSPAQGQRVETSLGFSIPSSARETEVGARLAELAYLGRGFLYRGAPGFSATCPFWFLPSCLPKDSIINPQQIIPHLFSTTNASVDLGGLQGQCCSACSGPSAGLASLQCQLQLQGWQPDWEKQGVTPSPAPGLLGGLPTQEPLSEP